MIILGLFGLYSLLLKMKPIMLLKDLPKLYKMRRIVVLLPLSQMMGENFRMRGLTSFVTNLESSTIFSAPRTPQKNGVVERKNRSLEELARTLLNETELPKYF